MMHPEHKHNVYEITNPQALRVHQRQRLVECGQSAFGPTMQEDEILDHLKGPITVATNDRGEIIGFGSAQTRSPRSAFNKPDLPGAHGLYLAGAAVHRDYQHTGAYHDITKSRINIAVKDKLPLVYTRTQNSKVDRGITKVLDEYQRAGVIKNYTATHEPLPAVYGRMLTERRPPVPAGSPFEKLNFERGDALVLMYKIVYP